MNPRKILEQVADIIDSRGHERDLEAERTIPRCVRVFNELTGSDMTAADGWLFMMILKMCRSRQGKFKLDDFLDLTGYSALLTEQVIEDNKI